MQTSPNQPCTEQLRCGSSIKMFRRCCTKANKPYRAVELITSVAVLDKHYQITSGFKLLHMHATVWHRGDLRLGNQLTGYQLGDLCMSSILRFSRAFLLWRNNPKSLFILTWSAFYHTHRNSPRPDLWFRKTLLHPHSHSLPEATTSQPLFSPADHTVRAPLTHGNCARFSIPSELQLMADMFICHSYQTGSSQRPTGTARLPQQ